MEKLLKDRLWDLRSNLIAKGFHDIELFRDISTIQDMAGKAEFDVHRLTIEVNHLREENLELKVKAMSEYDWEVEQKLGQEELNEQYQHELREAI